MIDHGQTTVDHGLTMTCRRGSQFEDGCNRSFLIGWLEEYPWLVCGSALDGAFCITCALFANPRSGLGILVNKPFIKWRKKSEYITPHALKKYHVDAWQTLSSVTQSNSEENFDGNFGILKYIIEAVLFCGRQCIAFRTRNESDLDGSVNPGNFLAFLKMVARHDDALMEHLTSPIMRNATYLSPDIHNELISRGEKPGIGWSDIILW